MTDTVAPRSAAIEAAEAQRQVACLMAAMASISPVISTEITGRAEADAAIKQPTERCASGAYIDAVTLCLSIRQPFQRPISSYGVNGRKRRTFNRIWRHRKNRPVPAASRFNPATNGIIAPCSSPFMATNRLRFNRPLLTVYVFVDLINTIGLGLFQFGCGNLFLMSRRWIYQSMQAFRHNDNSCISLHW